MSVRIDERIGMAKFMTVSRRNELLLRYACLCVVRMLVSEVTGDRRGKCVGCGGVAGVVTICKSPFSFIAYLLISFSISNL